MFVQSSGIGNMSQCSSVSHRVLPAALAILWLEGSVQREDRGATAHAEEAPGFWKQRAYPIPLLPQGMTLKGSARSLRQCTGRIPSMHSSSGPALWRVSGVRNEKPEVRVHMKEAKVDYEQDIVQRVSSPDLPV